jgi:hypothetical protein
MTIYEDFPEELAALFPIEDAVIPVTIRTVIVDGWDCMDLTQQKLFVAKMKLVKDPIQRALVAVFEASKVLLNEPPENIIY